MNNSNSNSVKVVADDLGNVIRVSTNNPEYGVIRVVQESVQFSNGWMRRKEKSALIPGFVEDLQSLKWKNGQEVEGQVVVKESLEAFNENDPDRDLKYAFAGGPLCVYEDQPIYRRTFFTTDMNDTDEYVQHTNSSEIREASAENSAPVEKKATPKKEKVAEPVTAEVEEELDEDTGDVSFDF
jgi:hypothetical protein